MRVTASGAGPKRGRQQNQPAGETVSRRTGRIRRTECEWGRTETEPKKADGTSETGYLLVPSSNRFKTQWESTAAGLGAHRTPRDAELRAEEAPAPRGRKDRGGGRAWPGLLEQVRQRGWLR